MFEFFGLPPPLARPTCPTLLSPIDVASAECIECLVQQDNKVVFFPSPPPPPPPGSIQSDSHAQLCVCVWRGVFFFLVSLIICIRQQRAGIDGQLGEYTACIHIPAPRTRGGRAASTTRAHTHIAHTHKKCKPKAGLSSNPERNREGGGKQKI